MDFLHIFYFKSQKLGGGFTAGSVVKNPLVNAEDTGSVPDLGRSDMPQSKPLHHNDCACAPEPQSCNY